jgi:uncharacterized protein involved in exopolysaccharide biosynthesis
MMKKLIAGVFVTAVAAMPLAAHADWNDLKQRGSNLEQQGKDLQQKGKELEAEGKAKKAQGEAAQARAKDAYDEGATVEKKTVTTYKKGRDYAKTTTKKVRKE